MKKSFYRIITIAALAFAAISCTSHAEMESVAPVSAVQVTDALTKADELFKQRAEIAKLREAVKTLAAVRNPDARNFDVEWKYARYCYFLGRATPDEKERDKVFDDGETAGRIASRLQPDKPDGHFWSAANLGEKAKISPVTVGAKSVDEIRGMMNRVIELDAKYQNAAAYDALAQIELQTAGILGGDPKKAIDLLEKALTIEQNNTYLRLRLAEAYLATGRKPEAKKQLDELMKMKPNPDYLPEYEETVTKGKKLLETKF